MALWVMKMGRTLFDCGLFLIADSEDAADIADIADIAGKRYCNMNQDYRRRP